MHKTLYIFFWFVTLTWLTVGIIIIITASTENDSEFKEVSGILSSKMTYSYDDTEWTRKNRRAVSGKLTLDGDSIVYSINGTLLNTNKEGLDQLKKGDQVKMMIKFKNKVFKFRKRQYIAALDLIDKRSQKVDHIISFEDAKKEAPKRLVIGLFFIALSAVCVVLLFKYKP